MADASEPVKQPSDHGPWWMRPVQSLFTMTAEQQRGAVALILLGGAMWLIFSLVNSQQRVETERWHADRRANEAENERSRQMYAAEGERNRAAIAENSKAVTTSLSAVVSGMGRLEARITDLAAINSDLRKQIVELNAVITDLKRKLPPTEANYAPMPRAKAVTELG